jgi:hypothetical protein
MTSRSIMTAVIAVIAVMAVIALVAFAGTTAARTVTSQARGQTSADRQGSRPQITSRSVTRGEGADQTPLKKKTPSQKKELTTKAVRLAFIRKAQIWAPTDVSTMDLRAGPQGTGRFNRMRR